MEQVQGAKIQVAQDGTRWAPHNLLGDGDALVGMEAIFDAKVGHELYAACVNMPYSSVTEVMQALGREPRSITPRQLHNYLIELAKVLEDTRGQHHRDAVELHHLREQKRVVGQFFRQALEGKGD